MMRPATVVIMACIIPPLNWLSSTPAPLTSMVWKVITIPTTVPKNPSIGAAPETVAITGSPLSSR